MNIHDPRSPLAARSRRAIAPAVGCAAVALLARAAAARNDHFAPIGDEFVVNASTFFNQTWCRVDVRADASLIGFSYYGGTDPFARQFHLDGTPATGTLVCTPSLNLNTQDEPETAFSTGGNQLVVWSDRNGYDGELMGIYGRIFQPGGVPIGPEFQINQVGAASQWGPMLAARPDGGWVVSWSGDWDGDALFRVLAADGSFTTGDVAINTFDNGAQVDVVPAVASDGRTFFVYVDFSGHSGSGTGTNLWGRLFDASGAPLQALEFPLDTPDRWNGDQREPRVAADGLGRFVVVWEDATHDGSGTCILARRFDHDAQPLGPVFQVNTTTAGDQLNPRVAADALGNFVVCWEDWSDGFPQAPQADIRAQRFDTNGQPFGSEFVVHTNTAGDQLRPSLAMTPTSGHVVFSFDGPGVQADAYARIYSTYQGPQVYCTAKLNSLGCLPAISATGSATVSGADDFHVRASQVLNNKSGLLFWGLAPASIPFFGGTLCVQPPTVRMPIQNSFGSPGGSDCSGTYDEFFSHTDLQSHGLRVGDTVFAQYWSRDPGFAQPNDRSLTDALSFDVAP